MEAAVRRAAPLSCCDTAAAARRALAAVAFDAAALTVDAAAGGGSGSGSGSGRRMAPSITARKQPPRLCGPSEVPPRPLCASARRNHPPAPRLRGGGGAQQSCRSGGSRHARRGRSPTGRVKLCSASFGALAHGSHSVQLYVPLAAKRRTGPSGGAVRETLLTSVVARIAATARPLAAANRDGSGIDALGRAKRQRSAPTHTNEKISH